ncbi:trypsin-like peptidase domain-containing protein [bacterium]|nr:trypsin-like peptidase domain-containing protein [bacterium]QQR56746.1 MAG: trypsin-like peptidase domain-containing protein [Candidatus Melainabacteria bacterium]
MIKKQTYFLNLSLSLALGATLLGSLSTAPAQADSSSAVNALTPNSIADIAEKAAPAVVNIDVSPLVSNSSKLINRNLPPNTQVRINGRNMRLQDVEELLKKMEKGSVGSGTGFVVRDNGYIVTNNHVVANAGKIEVSFQNGKNYDAQIVGTDSFSDLAILKIDAKNLPTLNFGNSSKVRPGEFSIAIGSPMGFKHTVTFGIISAVGRDVHDINGNINFLQTDAAINRGNSGGPLINIKGEVIGVNTAIITKQFAQNIGFAIPADIAKNVIDDLITDKVVHRPWIGIAMVEVNEEVAETLNLPSDTIGVAVREVFKNGPAGQGGILSKDIIQKVDSKSVRSPKEVRDYILSKKIGQNIKLSVIRDGKPVELSMSVGQYPSQATPIPGSGKLP